MKAISRAKILAWVQLAVTYLNSVGISIPQSKAQWLQLASSAVVAAGIHIASSTSAGHPDGAKVPPTVASLGGKQ